MSKPTLVETALEADAQRMLEAEGMDLHDYDIAALMLSQAISTKRIADTLERIAAPDGHLAALIARGR